MWLHSITFSEFGACVLYGITILCFVEVYYYGVDISHTSCLGVVTPYPLIETYDAFRILVCECFGVGRSYVPIFSVGEV
jgi:hypothetical protein